MSAANYNQSAKRAATLPGLIRILRDLAVNSKDYAHINHHRANYNNVPLWVLVRVMTFGNISKMYQCFTQDLQYKISMNYFNIKEKELMQFLSVLTKFRNVCAHSDRLFSYETKDDIPDTDIHFKMGIAKNGRQYIYGKKDLFGVVIAFRYLLQRGEFIEFKRTLSRTINQFLSKTSNVSPEELLHEMGFPANWKKIASFKI